MCREQELLTSYPMPRADTFSLTQSTVTEKKLTRNNYRARMHELLCVEEMARYEQVCYLHSFSFKYLEKLKVSQYIKEKTIKRSI